MGGRVESGEGIAETEGGRVGAEEITRPISNFITHKQEKSLAPRPGLFVGWIGASAVYLSLSSSPLSSP